MEKIKIKINKISLLVILVLVWFVLGISLEIKNICIAEEYKISKGEVIKRKQTPEEKRKIIDRVIDKLKEGKYEEIDLLGLIKDGFWEGVRENPNYERYKEAIDPLIKIIETSSIIVGYRMFALSFLIEINKEKAAPILIDLMKNDEELKHYARFYFAHTFEKEAIPYIKELLLHKDFIVRLGAVKTLVVELEEDKHQFYPIIKEAIKHKDSSVRIRAIDILEWLCIDDEDSLKMIQSLLNDPDEKVRKEAQEVFERATKKEDKWKTWRKKKCF